MPMVTKIALLNLFSNNTEDSPSFEGLSSWNTRCSPKKSSGVRRMSSASSISSVASSKSDCSSCPNFENCGGDLNYENKNGAKSTAVASCSPSLREQMMKKLEW
mmetsp:Transcript_9308/g.19511  ORF Transcript_9308/g.19511 Transcript_9308/m.19511 type:complete len:104 (-) Transcript_9308:183-494(-)